MTDQIKPATDEDITVSEAIAEVEFMAREHKCCARKAIAAARAIHASSKKPGEYFSENTRFYVRTFGALLDLAEAQVKTLNSLDGEAGVLQPAWGVYNAITALMTALDSADPGWREK